MAEKSLAPHQHSFVHADTQGFAGEGRVKPKQSACSRQDISEYKFEEDETADPP